MFYFSKYLTVSILIGISSLTQAQISSDVALENTGILFTENLGQIADQNGKLRPDVLFSGQHGNLTFHLRDNGVSYQLVGIGNEELGIGNEELGHGSKTIQTTIYRTDINWLGINTDYIIERNDPIEKTTNYFLSHCIDGVQNVRSYQSVIYNNVYNGIDIKWYEKENQLEYDLALAPHADLSQVRFEINGATDLKINKEGQLIIRTPLGEIVENAPVAFQNGKEIMIEWAFLSNNVVGFKTDSYNRELALVIDPVIGARLWSTYLGGNGSETVCGSFIDNSGNMFVVGNTNSTQNLATFGKYQTVYGGGLNDIYMAKVNSSGAKLWATYYGGVGDDIAKAVVQDTFQNIYITGSTTTDSNFVSIGAHLPSFYGTSQAYLLKLAKNSSRLWCTYYGGTGVETGYGIGLDVDQNVYLVGETNSTTHISTVGSHQYLKKGSTDGFLVKFKKNGLRQWATYFGGSGLEKIKAVACDDSNNIYIGGESYGSTGGIATSGAFQTSNAGVWDSFIAKFNSSGTRQWGTYYGGPGSDWLQAMVTDPDQNLYVTGRTGNDSIFGTIGIHQSSHGGGYDGYLSKFRSNGTRIWSTYIGGTGLEATNSLFESNEKIYVFGSSSNGNGITSAGSYQPDFGGGSNDGFLMKLDSSGNREWSTLYGGDQSDWLVSGLINTQDKLVAFGYSESASDIATAGAPQDSLRGSSDAFMVSFCEGVMDSVFVTSCQSYTSPSGRHTWNVSGNYTDTFATSSGCDSLLFIILNITAPVVTSTSFTTVCDSGITTLSATIDRGTINWYLDSTTSIISDTGLTFNTLVTRKDTFYVSGSDSGCTSLFRTPVIVTVDTFPTIKSITPGFVCDSGQAVLKMTKDWGRVHWYDSATGGTRIYWNVNFLTPPISKTTTFYVATSNWTTCTSHVRKPVIAYVSSTRPTIDSTFSASRCDTGSIVLSAFTSSGTIQWFNSPSGGSLIDTGNNLTVSPLLNTANYYVQASDSGCTSTTRDTVLAKMFNTPSILSPLGNNACDSGMLSLSSSTSSGMIYWYDSATAGTILDSGFFFTSPLITTTTTYWVQAVDSGCTTKTRTPVIARIDTTPSITSTAPGYRCSIGPLFLSASANFGIITWHSTLTGSGILATGNNFTTAYLIESDTFYVQVEADGCTSERTAVIATVDLKTGSAQDSACFGYLSPSGRHTYKKSGIYTDTVIAKNGCDSILTLNVTVTKPDISYVQNGHHVTANAKNALYQWLKCSQSIYYVPWSVTKSYTFSKNGWYALEVNQNGCIDTSDCFLVNTVGFNSIMSDNDISLYPNPTSGISNLDFDSEEKSGKYIVRNQLGQAIVEDYFENCRSVTVDLSSRINGLYFIEVQTNDFGVYSFKVLKK